MQLAQDANTNAKSAQMQIDVIERQNWVTRFINQRSEPTNLPILPMAKRGSDGKPAMGKER